MTDVQEEHLRESCLQQSTDGSAQNKKEYESEIKKLNPLLVNKGGIHRESIQNFLSSHPMWDNSEKQSNFLIVNGEAQSDPLDSQYMKEKSVNLF